MLPPHFFYFLKPIPMASTKKTAPEAAPEVVWLHSKDLGETRPFPPAHAANLLKLQASKGYDHWQPAEAPAETDAA